MSKSTKRKHVTKEVLNELVLPEEHQTIVKVLGGRGNNLHEVETAQRERYLVSMPTKFRRNIWIKRGDFVLVQPISEGEKVKAEIINILYADQIRYIQSHGKWPQQFDCRSDGCPVSGSHTVADDDDISSGTSSEDDGLFVNTNRHSVREKSDPSDSESEG